MRPPTTTIPARIPTTLSSVWTRVKVARLKITVPPVIEDGRCQIEDWELKIGNCGFAQRQPETAHIFNPQSAI
jgi:hypothetical protein